MGVSTGSVTLGPETRLDETGLQCLRLKKGQLSEVGQVGLVAYPDVAPYVSLQ